ncbi:MAG: maleylpyruvate isomerase family mycothiol-dependent enzyme, partial [Actinomycetota bacterium]
MSNPARTERDLICDLFTEYGPDAPTLCAGWTTRDLAAHIAVRERRPDAAAGILIKPLSSYGDRVRTRTAARDWARLVATIRSGPPRLSPMRLAAIDRLANTVEFF